MYYVKGGQILQFHPITDSNTDSQGELNDFKEARLIDR